MSALCQEAAFAAFLDGKDSGATLGYSPFAEETMERYLGDIVVVVGEGQSVPRLQV